MIPLALLCSSHRPTQELVTVTCTVDESIQLKLQLFPIDYRKPKTEIVNKGSSRGHRKCTERSKLVVKFTWRKAQGARCEVRGARCEMRGARREARNSKLETRGARREARGARREARGARREARGARRGARGAKKCARRDWFLFYF